MDRRAGSHRSGAWYKGALAAFLRLETFPERCPIAPESDSFDHDIRQLIYGKRQHAYRILFDVTGKKVRILHIRHGAREHMTGEEWAGE
ncbi:MAG: type II toxin-antitoxin system RelE/ParE family toxin [Verrucomicrobia bacterium]|nr:type II toxin-antitoxin system RelE/ParE family toxin [Verrucomicrobiota bacterium]MBI3867149.1 type II toxin-antitoxin system RelE/ParE family toxin [Verrucomicrobiota bacterium]